jgi:lactoylglutathione lyase
VPPARLIGINHVALEVGDLDAALELYGRLFSFELRGRGPGAAFIDIGDQFLAISEGRAQGPDDSRHFGLVVDDKEAVRAAVVAEGNRIEVVAYADIQFERVPPVKRKLGIEDLGKTEKARREIAARGLA